MDEPPTPLGEMLGMALIALMREHRAAVAHELAPLGLHVGQEMLLDALVRADGPTQAELARTMCVEAPTVTKMLQRLDGSGLLERHPDPGDRRRIRVRPTERGHRLHTQILRRWAEVDARMLATLSPDRIEAFREALSVMTGNLARHADDQRAAGGGPADPTAGTGRGQIAAVDRPLPEAGCEPPDPPLGDDQREHRLR